MKQTSMMYRIKSSRKASFWVMTLIYIAVTAAGYGLYLVMPGQPWLKLLLADVLATVITFLFSLIFGNASVYDPYWSVQPPVILTFFAVGRSLTASGVLMLIAVWFWGIRLTANWAYTFHGLTHQDWRYTMLHDTTGIFYPLINFIGIHMVPTLIVYMVTWPAVELMQAGLPLNAGNVIFFCLSVGAAVWQGTADWQMHSYRRNRTGAFIRVGLWKHSRHPNYLGEITMWWGIGLSAFCSMPERWWLLAGALANTILFLTVSIPMADKRQGKKPGFDAYRRATRILLPIPRFGKQAK